MDLLLTRLRTLLPLEAQADDQLLVELLAAAQALILNYTGRQVMPEALTTCQLSLAVQAYNRLGTEGEKSRREGGLALQFEDMPASITSQLRAWRLARTVSL